MKYENIPPKSNEISTQKRPERSIFSCSEVPKEYGELAVRVLHSAYDLDAKGQL